MPQVDVLSALTGLVKENYTGSMYSTVIQRSEWLDIFKQNSQVHDGPDGKYFLLSAMIGAPEGSGARFENDFLPVPGIPSFINPRVNLKYNYSVIQATWQGMKNAVTGPAAFGNFAEVTLLPAVKSLVDRMDTQTAGYGVGIVCRVQGVSGSTITIDRPWGIGSLNAVKGWLPGVRRGSSLVFSTISDGSALRAGGQAATVLTVNPLANSGSGSVTVDAVPAGVAQDDYVFFGDAAGSDVPGAGVPRVMMGIDGMVDDGTILNTLENIDRSVTFEWKSPVIDGNAAPYSGNVTANLLMRAVDDALLFGNGNVNMLVTSRSCFRNAFATLQTAQGGFGATQQNQSGSYTVGAKGIKSFSLGKELELRGVNKIIPGRLYALDTSTLHGFTLGQGEWDETAGASMWRQVMSGTAVKDAFFTYYRVPRENAIDDPRKSCKITGLSETSAG